MARLTNAQARAALGDAASAPSHLEMFSIANALDGATGKLAGGLEVGLAQQILTLWFRQTWRKAGRTERVTHPYQPQNVRDAALKSVEGRLAVSIADSDEAALRAFARHAAPPLIRARFFDVLWERFRRPDDAAAAIDAFLSYAMCGRDDAWPDVENALGRAASLISVRKDAARVACLLAAFDHAATAVLAGQYYFAYACIADTLIASVLRAKAIRAQVPGPFRERWVVVLSWMSESFFGVDAHYGQTCFLVLAEWESAQGNSAGAAAARRRLVEHLLACATQGSALAGSTHAAAALDHALRFGFVDLVEHAKVLVQDRVLASQDEMRSRSFEFTLPTVVVAEIDHLIDSAPSAAHAVRSLGTLVGLCDVPVENVRRAAEAQLSLTVFAALVPSMHVRDGKIAFVANDPEAKLREAIGRTVDVHLSAVEHLLHRALQRLAARVAPSTMVDALAGCRWLPRSVVAWLERASERFHAGDMMSSGLIVAMQYEAILRELVRGTGASGLKTDGDGTLMDETLGSLFRQEALRTALGEDHLFFVEYVIANPSLGPNLRNELAHGNAAPWHLTAPRVLLLWLFVIRLTFFRPNEIANVLARDEPSHDDIAKAAYFRWIEGGSVQGHDIEDWSLAAEDLRRRPF